LDLFSKDGNFHRVVITNPSSMTIGRVLERENEKKPESKKKVEPSIKLDQKKPNRSKVITTDEVVNMRIALEEAKDVNDFLKAVEGG